MSESKDASYHFEYNHLLMDNAQALETLQLSCNSGLILPPQKRTLAIDFWQTIQFVVEVDILGLVPRVSSYNHFKWF